MKRTPANKEDVIFRDMVESSCDNKEIRRNFQDVYLLSEVSPFFEGFQGR